MPDKPKFTLVQGDPSLEEIAQLFEHLTGRIPTPEDKQEVENILRQHPRYNDDDGNRDDGEGENC